MKAFTEAETLEGDAAFSCGSCRQRCKATKRLTLRRCPLVLVLTLKRFSAPAGRRPTRTSTFGLGSSFGSRNDACVSIALDGLDMRPYCSGSAAGGEGGDSCRRQARSGGSTYGAADCRAARAAAAGTCSPVLGAATYELAAVSHHSGSLQGGHYTAHCRHPGSGQWHSFNDAHVSDVAPAGASASAYVLFYIRHQLPAADA